MTDYRIDVERGIAFSGMKEGHPEAHQEVVVTISRKNWGFNGRENKPTKLWGPVILRSPDATHLLEGLGPIYEEVVRRAEAGESTDVRDVQEALDERRRILLS